MASVAEKAWLASTRRVTWGAARNYGGKAVVIGVEAALRVADFNF